MVFVVAIISVTMLFEYAYSRRRIIHLDAVGLGTSLNNPRLPPTETRLLASSGVANSRVLYHALDESRLPPRAKNSATRIPFSHRSVLQRDSPREVLEQDHRRGNFPCAGAQPAGSNQ
jgi:hypothetical protein